MIKCKTAGMIYPTDITKADNLRADRLSLSHVNKYDKMKDSRKDLLRDYWWESPDAKLSVNKIYGSSLPEVDLVSVICEKKLYILW